MLTRSALTAATAAALVTAWPLAAAVLAQTAVPSHDDSPPLLVTLPAAPPADELLIVEPLPPLPPIEISPEAAPEPQVAAPLASAPAAEPQAVASPPLATTPGSAASAASSSDPRKMRRSVTRTAKAQALGSTLTVLNSRENPVVSVTITAGDTMVRQTAMVAPNARATVVLPKTIDCTVTIEAVFQDEGVSEVRSINACKVKVVRLTD